LEIAGTFLDSEPINKLMYIAIDETELEVKTNSQCMPAADADTKNIALDIYYQRRHLLILNGLIGVYT
jgi:hypothetical protein